MTTKARISTLTCLALIAPGMALARAQEPGAPAPSGAGRATAGLVDCRPAVDQAARDATFEGQMTPLAGADHMAMRMDLQERSSGSAAFRNVSAPNLGVWRRAAGNVAVFRYLKQVTNLPAPAAFRVLVEFRWTSSSGRTIRSTQRRSAVCNEPDPRPRLIARDVTVFPATESQARYRVTLDNSGHGPAGPFTVVIAVNGQSLAPLTVSGLGSGTTALLEQTGTRCAPGSNVTVSLDPAQQVPEAPGGGRALAVSCPPGTAS